MRIGASVVRVVGILHRPGAIAGVGERFGVAEKFDVHLLGVALVKEHTYRERAP